MHRSGTSVISQWLYHCGLHLGERLLGPGTGNTEGHFEDLDFLKFHEEVLMENAGAKPENPGTPQKGQISPTQERAIPENESIAFGYIHQPLSNLSRYQQEKLRAIINFKSKLNQQWGWKEPRTCLFLDYYRELIPEAYYLVIIRNYSETVSSLIQRDLKTLDNYYLTKSWVSRQNWKRRKRAQREEAIYQSYAEFYLKVWVTYNESLLKTIKSLPASQFLVTEHNLLSDQHEEVFNTLTGQWNFNLHYTDFRKIYKKGLLTEVTLIDTFVKNKMLLEKARALEAEIKAYL